MSDRDDVDLGVTLDKWGFRYRGSPGDLGEAKPASWRQVWRQVNRHLMRLVSGVPRFLAEAVEGVTRIARSTVSRAAAVEAAHAEAELWEEAHRRLPAAVGVSKRRQRAAGRRLAALLARYRAGGHVAEVLADAEGRPMVVIVRREAPNFGRLGAGSGEGQGEAGGT